MVVFTSFSRMDVISLQGEVWESSSGFEWVTIFVRCFDLTHDSRLQDGSGAYKFLIALLLTGRGSPGRGGRHNVEY